MSAAHERKGIRGVPAHSLPGGMGGLCEAAVWRAGACPAEGISEDSLFRLDGLSSTRSPTAALPSLARFSASSGHLRSICSEVHLLAVSPLPRPDACSRT